MPRSLLKATLPFAMGLALTACAPMVTSSGHKVSADKLEEIQVGLTTKQEVYRALGSPSSISSFDDNKWYYISQQTQQYAFMEPELTDRQILIIHFDDTGYVTGMDTRGEEHAQDIDPVGRKTPTAGREVTFMEQLLGNVGRFKGQ